MSRTDAILAGLGEAINALHRGLRERDERLAEAVRRLENATGAATPSPTPSRPVQQTHPDYPQIICRAKEIVEASVPAGAIVAVISKGDEQLIQVSGRTGWHFPRTASGAYAGHHPADSAAAIAHLESLRAQGAEYLLIPATAFWWLSHYADFGRHLEREYSLVVKDKACRLYGVRKAGKSSAPASPTAKQQVYEWMIREMRQIVKALLPANASVAVISRGDDAMLRLGRRKAFHFPSDAKGHYAGHHPADNPDALAMLEAVRKAGAQFLVIPATAYWWLDHYTGFAGHLRASGRLVTRQRHVCTIYDLGANGST